MATPGLELSADALGAGAAQRRPPLVPGLKRPRDAGGDLGADGFCFIYAYLIWYIFLILYLLEIQRTSR